MGWASTGWVEDPFEPTFHIEAEAMADRDPEIDPQKPSEQRTGSAPDAAEVCEKGEWAGTSDEGIVPPDLGGSDAPREMLADDPELGSSVLGRTTGSTEPATESGVDLSAGDSADAITDGGPEVPEDVEPDQKDSIAAARKLGGEPDR